MPAPCDIQIDLKRDFEYLHTMLQQAFEMLEHEDTHSIAARWLRSAAMTCASMAEFVQSEAREGGGK